MQHVLGFLLFCSVLFLLLTIPVTKKKKKFGTPKSKKIKTMDLILIIIGIFMLIFIGVMIYIFVVCGSVPDSLVAGVFALSGGECGIMGWIKTSKERYQDRQWELEDRKSEEMEGDRYDE